MSDPSVTKAICEKCGVDVRENTAFCYNCGLSVVAKDLEPSSIKNGSGDLAEAENKAILDDLASRLKLDDQAENRKLALAAAKRKKARVSPRKAKEFVWVPVEEGTERFPVLIAVLISVITLAIVFITIRWR
ncbi:MAG: zinc ribbon domain-containing protein [Pyrinomonadaceae bacterium]